MRTIYFASAAILTSVPALGQPQTLNSPVINQPTINMGTFNSPTIAGATMSNPVMTNPMVSGPLAVRGGALTLDPVNSQGMTWNGATNDVSITAPLRNPLVAGSLALNGNPVKIDPAGNFTVQWNAGNNDIQINGPIWNSSVQYAPWASPAVYNWNLDAINYSVNASQVPSGFDSGQSVAKYMQMTKYGSANTQLWASVAEMHDYTGQGVGSGGAEIVEEFDLAGNGAITQSGPLGAGARGVIDIVGIKAVPTGPAVDLGYAIAIHSPPNLGGWFEYGLQEAAEFSVAAYDTRYAGFMAGAHDIWLGDGNDIAFDTAATNFMRWNPVTMKTEFTGSMFFMTTMQMHVYTVATLPSCASWSVGGFSSVSDALNPAYNAPVVGGGTNNIPVYCNGTKWTAH